MSGTPVTKEQWKQLQQRKGNDMSTDYPNSGALFRNHDKAGPKHADYNGSLNVDGAEYWINGWIKDGARGKFLSLSVKPKQAAGGAGRSAKMDDDDAMPFAPAWA